MEQNNETIYLETDEEIIFIIDRLRKNKARKITLVVPKKAKLFQSVINLKILKEQAEKLKKDIAVITTDNAGKNMASEAGLAIHRQIKLPGDSPEIELNNEANNEMDKTNNKTNNKINDEQEIHPKKLSVNVGGIKVGQENSIIHLENNESQNQKQEIPENAGKEIKQTKIFDIDREKHNLNEDGSLETNSQLFDDLESENEFDLFGSPLPKKRTVSLLPTLSAKFFAVFIFACLTISVIAALFVLPEAKVDIFLKTERVANNFEFIVDKNIIEPDIQLNRLPANTIEVISKESSEFPATGKKQLNEKASGIITVYNEYSTGQQLLVANTRFFSKEGKIFRVKKNITIPGFTKPKDEIIPGTVEVEVFAEEAGESYNIKPTSFTVPAFQEMGSPKYFGIYARSTVAMSGGSTREVLVLSEADISRAKKVLLESLKKKNTLGIENEIGANDKFISDTREDEIMEVGLSNKVGEQTEKAVITIELASKILTVKQNDINILVNHNFDAELSGEMELVSESKKMEYGDSYLNADGNIIFPVYVEQEVVRTIDTDQIKRDIINKNESELRTFFSEIEGIETVNISFWPFWVKNVPQSVKKIRIEIK